MPYFEKSSSPPLGDVGPLRPFLILAAWELPKPIHFWKGHQKSGRNKVVKIWGVPQGVGTNNFQSMPCNIPF